MCYDDNDDDNNSVYNYTNVPGTVLCATNYYITKLKQINKQNNLLGKLEASHVRHSVIVDKDTLLQSVKVQSVF